MDASSIQGPKFRSISRKELDFTGFNSKPIDEPRFIEDDNDAHIDLKSKLENPNRIRRHTRAFRNPLVKAKQQLS